jgi:hypothetical protein
MVATVNLTTTAEGNILYTLEDGTIGQCAFSPPFRPLSVLLTLFLLADNLGDLAWVRSSFPRRRRGDSVVPRCWSPSSRPSSRFPSSQTGHRRDCHRRHVCPRPRSPLCACASPLPRPRLTSAATQTRACCAARMVRRLCLLLPFADTDKSTTRSSQYALPVVCRVLDRTASVVDVRYVLFSFSSSTALF